MNWSLVVASNSEEVLRGNLLCSAEASKAKEIIIQLNPENASRAYNTGLAEAMSDIVVFAHQDVYLPDGWANQLATSIEELIIVDPNWGVAGVYGVTELGQGAGYVYSCGLRCFVGEPFKEPVHVSTLDEMVLIIRKSSGLHFDDRLPGFHLYGTDICFEAETKGMKNYVIPCFAMHNSCGIDWLPLSFWKAYMYLRKKWYNRLPIVTPCTKISVGCSAIFDHILRNSFQHIRGKKQPGYRIMDPESFYKKRILPSLHVSIK